MSSYTTLCRIVELYRVFLFLLFPPVADVKKKWTNIKDSFVKDVKGKKPRKSRGPPEHRKKYYLFDHLQFLIPFIQESKGGGAGRSAEDGGETTTRKKIRRSLGEGTSSSRAHAATVAAETTAGKPEMPPDVQQHADLLNNFAGKSASDALCHLDDDLSFLLSLLPTIKSLNEKQKINYKIGVLQVLARLKFNEVLQQPAEVAYQPFATPDLRCFPVPYQPNIPFPFISQATAVSSTQQRQQQHVHTAAAASTMKLETVDSNSPPSSYFDTDLDDDEDDDGNGVDDSNH